jgi:replicative DNA helicase
MSENFNLNIERAVLRSLIFEPELLEDVKVFLTPEDFYIPAHQSTYNAITSMRM